MRSFVLVASILFIVVATNANEVDNKHLECLVCRAAIKEVGSQIAKVDPKRNIEIGNYRLDAAGNEIKKTVPMARSAIHISDVLEGVCEKFSDYVRATYKSNGKLTILNLMSPNGGMNPEISKVDIVQDGDLNKSLEFLCEGVIDEREKEIMEFFQTGEKVDVSNGVCATICDDTMPNDEDEVKEEEHIAKKTEL